MQKKKVRVALGQTNVLNDCQTINELIKRLQEIQANYQKEYGDIEYLVSNDWEEEPTAMELMGYRLETTEEFERRKQRSELAKKGAKKRSIREQKDLETYERKLLAKLQKKYKL